MQIEKRFFEKFFERILKNEKKVHFHTDAAQMVGKVPIDVKAMNISMMSLSGHKIYGPKGIFSENFGILKSLMIFRNWRNLRLKASTRTSGANHFWWWSGERSQVNYLKNNFAKIFN